MSGDDLAYDRGSDILYAFSDGDGSFLYGYNYGSETAAVYTANEPLDYNFGIGSIAVDAQGYVYAPLYHNTSESDGIGKIAVGNPSGGFAETQAVLFKPLADLGFAPPLEIRDMTVKDGRLYVLVGENISFGTPHHGKLVELDLDTFVTIRELGWTSANYPTDPATQLYGPQRFIALAPRKLILADEGSDGIADVDRVVEIDIEAWSMSDIALEGVVTFFNSYAC
jgi:hypothetical protein